MMFKRLLFVAATLTLLLCPVLSAQARDPNPRAWGAEALARAKVWVNAREPYNQGGSRDGYRTDCSGFASYAWQLTTNGKPDSPDTTRLSQYFVDIPIEALMPGDIVNNKRPDNSGHVVIFIKWVKKGESFEAYEENGAVGRALKAPTPIVFKPMSGGFYLYGYERAPGPYYAQRFNGMPGVLTVLDFRVAPSNPSVGQPATTAFTLRNDGGQPVTVRQFETAVRGPGAAAQGWSAPVADFPGAGPLTLGPGQSYKYSVSRTFAKKGDYFAEPVKDENGWGGIWPWPRINFTVR